MKSCLDNRIAFSKKSYGVSEEKRGRTNKTWEDKYFVPQSKHLQTLKHNYLAIEMSQNNALAHGELQRCQSQRTDTQITAEIMPTQTY